MAWRIPASTAAESPPRQATNPPNMAPRTTILPTYLLLYGGESYVSLEARGEPLRKLPGEYFPTHRSRTRLTRLTSALLIPRITSKSPIYDAYPRLSPP